MMLELDLSESQLAELQTLYWAGEVDDLHALAVAMIASDRTAVLDAVASMETDEGWQPPACPRCDHPVDGDGELWMGLVYHHRCVTDGAWELVKDLGLAL